MKYLFIALVVLNLTGCASLTCWKIPRYQWMLVDGQPPVPHCFDLVRGKEADESLCLSPLNNSHLESNSDVRR